MVSYTGILEKKMETTIVYYGDNGKENGHYYSGLYSQGSRHVEGTAR